MQVGFVGQKTQSFQNTETVKKIQAIPTGSMGRYIYLHLLLTKKTNIGVYTIHGSYGVGCSILLVLLFFWGRKEGGGSALV